VPLADVDGVTVSVALADAPAARLKDVGLKAAVQPVGTDAPSARVDPLQLESLFFTVTV